LCRRFAVRSEFRRGPLTPDGEVLAGHSIADGAGKAVGFRTKCSDRTECSGGKASSPPSSSEQIRKRQQSSAALQTCRTGSIPDSRSTHTGKINALRHHRPQTGQAVRVCPLPRPPGRHLMPGRWHRLYCRPAGRPASFSEPFRESIFSLWRPALRGTVPGSSAALTVRSTDHTPCCRHGGNRDTLS
jgi:hypothetical protein